MRNLCPQNICNSARLFPKHGRPHSRGKRDRFNFIYIAQNMKNKIRASFASLQIANSFIIQIQFATMSSAFFLFLLRMEKSSMLTSSFKWSHLIYLTPSLKHQKLLCTKCSKHKIGYPLPYLWFTGICYKDRQ